MQLDYIITTINDVLQEISKLKYIDRNWGQLELETPAVKFPCALTDVETVNYENLLQRHQHATAEISVTVAMLNYHNTSQKSTCKADGFDIFSLLETIHSKLQCLGTQYLEPLTRISLQKIEVDKNYSCYQLRYRTGFNADVQTQTTTAKITPKITSELI